MQNGGTSEFAGEDSCPLWRFPIETIGQPHFEVRKYSSNLLCANSIGARKKGVGGDVTHFFHRDPLFSVGTLIMVN